MKISFIAQPFDGVLPPNQNSIGILVYELARRLVGPNNVLVYTKNTFASKRPEYVEGINFRYISLWADRRILKYLGRMPDFNNFEQRMFASLLYYLIYILQVALDLRRQKCDLIHIFNFSQFVPVIRFFNPKAKIVLHMTCEWLTQLDKRMVDRRLRKTDLIIGCSEYITEKIRTRFSQHASRCQTVYNGVNVDRFLPKEGLNRKNRENKTNILFVGRVSPEKGVHVIMDAFLNIAKLFPRAHLNIVGPQVSLPIDYIVKVSDDPKVQALASLYNENYSSFLMKKIPPEAGDKVSFHGFVTDSQLNSLYENADIFVNASFSESFPLPVLEAMATRTPVVASRVGGIPESVLDKETGLLFETGNENELTKAILTLLQDEALRNYMGNAAFERTTKLFSWDRIARELMVQYKKFLTKGYESEEKARG